jgi:DNA-binding transcriptional ArsR family regulator
MRAFYYSHLQLYYFFAFLANQIFIIMLTAATENQLKIEVLLLKKAALVLRAVNHDLRQGIMQLIHDNSTLTVTQIYTRLKLEQSVASQHLAILRRVGFVNTKREGKQIFYSVNYARLNDVTNQAKKLIQSK